MSARDAYLQAMSQHAAAEIALSAAQEAVRAARVREDETRMAVEKVREAAWDEFLAHVKEPS